MKKALSVGRVVFFAIAVMILITLPRFYSNLVANLRILPFVKIATAQTGVCHPSSSQLDIDYIVTAAQFERDEQKTRLVEKSISERVPFESYVTLFWNSVFSFTLDIPIQNYELQLYGKHDRPGPVILRIFANDNILGVLTFDEDDDSWGGQCLCLSPDYWLDNERLNIQVEFVNDGGVGGDRDASIAWIRFTPFLPGEADQ